MGPWFGKQAIHSAPTLARTTAASHLHQDHRLGWITAALVDAVEVPTRTGTWWAGTGSTARTADLSVRVPHTAGSGAAICRRVFAERELPLTGTSGRPLASRRSSIGGHFQSPGVGPQADPHVGLRRVDGGPTRYRCRPRPLPRRGKWPVRTIGTTSTDWPVGRLRLRGT
jgi:hypothetical protein